MILSFSIAFSLIMLHFSTIFSSVFTVHGFVNILLLFFSITLLISQRPNTCVNTCFFVVAGIVYVGYLRYR